MGRRRAGEVEAPGDEASSRSVLSPAEGARLTKDRSAALVVRVWLEDGTQFRARVSAVAPDGSGGDDVTIAVASSSSDVLAAVGEWLDAFAGNGTQPY